MLGDKIAIVLDGKMSCVQPMNLYHWQVLEVRLAALGSEEAIALSPEDERVRLVIAQKGLPCWIQRHVRSK